MQLTTRSSRLIWTGALCALSAVGFVMLPQQSDGNLAEDGGLNEVSPGQSMPEEILLQVGPREVVATANSPQSNTQPALQTPPTKAPVEKQAPPVIWQRPGNASPWDRRHDDAINQQLRLRHQQLRDKFKEPVEVKFNGIGLAAVMSRFATTLDIPIVVDEVALESEAISLDEQITLSLKHEISFKSALKLILSPLNLTYILEDEVLKITTMTGSANVLRTYDLSYLLPDNSTALEVVSIITQTVSSDSWEVAGGLSSITIFGSLLVANCPEETHDGIDNALHLLGNQSSQNIKPAPASKQPMGGMGGMF